jgi:hypothetical protein
MSFRHRARALSTQTRGPYSVRPWSCCCEKHPCFIKLPEGHGTHHPPPERRLVMNASGVLRRRGDLHSRVKTFRTGEASLQIPVWFVTATLGGPQTQRRFRRRRGGWGISHRRLGSDREVGPSSSSRDGRHTVHASAWTRAVRGAGERYPTHLGDAGHQCLLLRSSLRHPLPPTLRWRRPLKQVLRRRLVRQTFQPCEQLTLILQPPIRFVERSS